MNSRIRFLSLITVLIFSFLSPAFVLAAEENIYLSAINKPEDVSGVVSTLDISSDNRYLAAGYSESEFVYIWNTKNRQLHKKLTVTGSRKISKVVFSPDASVLATINGGYSNDYPDQESTISLWDVETGQLILELKGHSERVYDIAFSPDGGTLASISHDDTLILWDTLTGNKKMTIDVPDGRALDFHPTKNELAVGIEPYNQKRTIHIIDYHTGDHLKSLPIEGTVSYNYVNRLEYSPDGKKLLLSLYEYTKKTPVIFNVEENYKRQDDVNFQDVNRLGGMIFTNNSQFIIHFGSSDLQVFNVLTGEMMYETYIGNLYDVAISPDDTMIATGSYDSISFWDTSDLADVKILDSIQINDSDNIEIYSGSETPLTVTAHYKNGETEVLTSRIEWKTSNYTVAIMDENNQLIGRREGETVLTATYQGFSDTVNVKVNEGFTSWEPEFDVPTNKSWDVVFNLPLDISTILEKNIYVTNKRNEIVPVLYVVDRTKSDSKVTVFPAKDYESGETYTLWIKNVKSESGAIQKQFVKKEFTTK